MKCKDVKENLSAYLDQALDSEESKLVEEHLASCAECQEEYNALKETVLMLSSLEEVIPPASFRRELRHKLEAQAKKKRFSLPALIPNWMKKLNRTQLMPVAVAAVLMIVILPFVTNNLPKGMGKLAQDKAESLGAGIMMEQSAAPEESSDSISYSLDQNMAKMAPPSGRDGGEMLNGSAPNTRAAGMPTTPSADSTNEAASPTVATEEVIERKIIKNADVSLQVDDYNGALESLKQRVASVGGYIANESVNVSGREGQINGHLQVRLPALQFEDFLSSMDGIGKVRSRNIYTQDVTEEYVDVESRLKALRTKEERLLAILEKSGNLSDVLAVENELANTRAQLESFEGRLRYLNNRTDYSSVNISIQQVSASTQQISSIGIKDVLKKTKEAFIETINNILIGIGELIVFLGSSFPYLVLIGLVLVIVWWWIKKRGA